MKKVYLSLILLLATNGAFAYQDYDIDGIDDSVDLCPNTPFDELVDKNGCSKSQKPQKNIKDYGHLTLKVGTNIYRDEDYDDDESINLYANYRYKSWDLSISNTRSISTSSSYDEDNSYSDNDVYISLGKTFNTKKGIVKLSVGTKIAGDVDEDEVDRYVSSQRGRLRKYGIEQGSTQNSNALTPTQTTTTDQYSSTTTDTTMYEQRDNDYFASINYSYPLSTRQNIFLYYGYTLSGDSKSVDYENFSSFSIGTGYMITKNWYSAISYNYTGSIYKDGDPTETLNWYNSYNFTKYVFASAGYSYALDDISYQNTYSLALGVNF